MLTVRKKTILVTLIIILLLSGGIYLAVQDSYRKQDPSGEIGPEESLQAVRFLTGIVVDMGDDWIKIDSEVGADQFPLPENVDFETEEVKVSIKSFTEIFTMLSEDPADYDIETGPPPLREVDLDVQGIKEGDRVAVIYSPGEENDNEETIFATYVEVLNPELYTINPIPK